MTGGLPTVMVVELDNGRQRLKKSLVGYVGKQNPAFAREPPLNASLVKLLKHFMT
jgi:hypothetical protein